MQNIFTFLYIYQVETINYLRKENITKQLFEHKNKGVKECKGKKNLNTWFCW